MNDNSNTNERETQELNIVADDITEEMDIVADDMPTVDYSQDVMRLERMYCEALAGYKVGKNKLFVQYIVALAHDLGIRAGDSIS